MVYVLARLKDLLHPARIDRPIHVIMVPFACPNRSLLGALCTVSDNANCFRGYSRILASLISVGITMLSKFVWMSHNNPIVVRPWSLASSASHALSSAASIAEEAALAESLFYALAASNSVISSLSNCMRSLYNVAAIAIVLVPPSFLGMEDIRLRSSCSGAIASFWIAVNI